MDERKRDEMAYFRYAVITPLLNCDQNGETVNQKLKELASRIWTLPDGRIRQFAWGSIEKWLYNYKRHGLNGLRDVPRRDIGAFRGMPANVSEVIDNLLAERPELKPSSLIRLINFQGLLYGSRAPSRSTLFRYIKSRRPLIAPKQAKERRSFEAPYAGSLWQTDIMYGPYINVKRSDGKRIKKQTYLVAIIDDHSRLIVHGEFFLSQDVKAYLKTLKKAILKRGIPEKLYCDNGQVFLSPHIKQIAAELGTLVLHTKVRDASAKGKIERFFRTVRDRFLEPLYIEKKIPDDLEILNQYFQRWVEMGYNSRVHGSLDCTPMKKWLASADKIRMLKSDRVNSAFRFSVERRVRKDGTFSLNQIYYETSWSLSGKKVRVLYDPLNESNIEVFYQGISYGLANQLEKGINYSLPRGGGDK